MTANGKLNIDFTFRQTESSDGLKQHTEEKLSKTVGKLLQDGSSIHVVLQVEKNRHIAEVTFPFLGQQVIAKGEEADMYRAVDRASEAALSQIKKLKEKTVNHHV